MKPISMSEKMLYSTVRIVSSNGGAGTGFFFNFKIDDKVIPTIITNKHVVNYNCNEKVSFYLHIATDKYDNANIRIDYDTHWYFHPDHDLCFCFIVPLKEYVKSVLNENVFYVAIDEKIMLPEDKLKDLSAIEEVTMVGYPIGLWDEINNFPIFRKGITASHPALDFNRPQIGLLDMACFPGSSGSPIFILNENIYSDKQGNSYVGSRIIFLGILFQGPLYNAEGSLVVTNIPTKQEITAETPIMTNLGYYVKSSELLKFKEIIREIINES